MQHFYFLFEQVERRPAPQDKSQSATAMIHGSKGSPYCATGGQKASEQMKHREKLYRECTDVQTQLKQKDEISFTFPLLLIRRPHRGLQACGMFLGPPPVSSPSGIQIRI